MATVARASEEEWNNELAEREKRNVSVCSLTSRHALADQIPPPPSYNRVTLTSATTTPRPTFTPSTPSPPPRSSTPRTPSTGPTPQQRGSRSVEWCSRLLRLIVAPRTSADLSRSNRYREAISDCSMALALDPMCVKALYRRGTALAMMGRWADSVKGESSLPLPSRALTRSS